MLATLFITACVGIHYLVDGILLDSAKNALRDRMHPLRRPGPPGANSGLRAGRLSDDNPSAPPPVEPPPADGNGSNPADDGAASRNVAGDAKGAQDGRTIDPESLDNREMRPQRYDRQGNWLPPFNHKGLWDPEGFREVNPTDREIFHTVWIDGNKYLILTMPGRKEEQGVAAVQAPYRLTKTSETLAELDRRLWMLVPVCLICAVLGGVFLTDRLLRPLRQMSRSAEHIGAQNFAERLPVIGDDEFSELAETFNKLLARQETAYIQQKRALEQMRRFTADASHELKTPLTVIQGNASIALSAGEEDTYRQALQEIETAAKGMSHLVHDLLLLARSDSGQLGRNVIELLMGELLGLAKSRVPRGDAHAPVLLRIEEADLSVIGNEGELVRLFSNLMDNAIHYTPADGKVVVSARRRGERGEWVEVKVSDNGIGIAPSIWRIWENASIGPIAPVPVHLEEADWGSLSVKGSWRRTEAPLVLLAWWEWARP